MSSGRTVSKGHRCCGEVQGAGRDAWKGIVGKSTLSMVWKNTQSGHDQQVTSTNAKRGFRVVSSMVVTQEVVPFLEYSDSRSATGGQTVEGIL